MKGREIRGYRLEDSIGQGGMGVIYRARHLATGQMVAVKMLHPRLTRDKMVQERFLREAQAQARLVHPHIAEIRSLVEVEGNHYIIMEYLEGESLADRIRRTGPIPPSIGLPIFRQVLDAVSHAHRLGVLHRDLKPGNVMLLDGDIAKVTDFGTAKILDAESLTLAGTAIGSPLYMAPEQLRAEPVSPVSDVYSLGITLYQMCTGKLPYEGESLADLLRHLKDDPPTPPSRHFSRIDPPLEEIILRAISKNRGERFPTADAFRDALDAYRTRLAGVSRAEAPSPQPRGINVWVVMILIVLSLILMLFMGVIGITPTLVAVIIFVVTLLARSGRKCPRCGEQTEGIWSRCPQCDARTPASGLRASLVGKDAYGGPVRWALPEGMVALGSKAPCEIIVDDREVSFRHAEIRNQEGELRLVDLESAAGTQVNGARLAALQPAAIYNGDRIDIGRTSFVVEAEPFREEKAP